MKKTILSIAIAVLSLTAISNKSQAQKKFYIGAQAAPQISVMWNEDDITPEGTDYQSKGSMTFGIGGGYHFTEKLGIGTELMYSIMKQQYLYDGNELTQQFNYLKIPVVFTFNSDPTSRVMFTAKLGPQIGILMKANITDATESGLNGSNKEAYCNVNFGAMGGAGIRVRISTALYLDAGIRLDGTITDTENKNHVSSAPARISSHDFNAGLELGIKYFF